MKEKYLIRIYIFIGILLMLTPSSWGGKYSIAHNFGKSKSDGFSPFAQPVLINSKMYGTTWKGGDNDMGMVYSLNTKKGKYRILHHFGEGDDGAQSQSGLYYYNIKLFGMTALGGKYKAGTIFSMKRNGKKYARIHDFGSIANDGSGPIGRLVAFDKMLCGVTTAGGQYDKGVIFQMNDDGSSYAVLHHFGDTPTDGDRPMQGLTRYNKTFYGMTMYGGQHAKGTIFCINYDGSGYTILHHFSETSSDGSEPWGRLLAANNKLYGTTMRGGAYMNGVLFSINPDGSGYENLHHFGQTIEQGTLATGGLTTDGKYLYGTTQLGGTFVTDGTLYSVNIKNGTHAILHDFGSVKNDGKSPYSGPVLARTTLYGCTFKGGKGDPGHDGAIYAYAIGPSPDAQLQHTAYTRENVTANNAYSAVSIEITSDNPGGNPLFLVQSHSQGRNGTVVHHPETGSFTYAPAYNFSGIDSFTYNDYDGRKGTVTIHVHPVAKRSDYNGDGRADPAIYASQNGNWYIRMSPISQPYTKNLGWSATTPATADYDGDGIMDLCVYWPEQQQWFIQKSSTGSISMPTWNHPYSTAAVPVPADYDQDGIADLALYDPAGGYWNILQSSSTGWSFQLGGNGAIAVPGDYNGDKQIDPAVYYPTSGEWHISDSNAAPPRVVVLGNINARPVPADYDGDGTTDIAIFSPGSGTWTIRYSSDQKEHTKNWGWNEVTPVPADYDGDGKDDIAVYHQATGNWYILNSHDDQCKCFNWGWSEAIPAAF